MLDGIVARLRARSIDDKLLASGVSEGRAPVLHRRTRLLHRRYRARVAASLRGLIDAARRNERTRFTARLQIKTREVLESEPLILTLADELEEEERVSARGVILADRLIRDGGSPVYAPDPIRFPRSRPWSRRSSTPAPRFIWAELCPRGPPSAVRM